MRDQSCFFYINRPEREREREREIWHRGIFGAMTRGKGSYQMCNRTILTVRLRERERERFDIVALLHFWGHDRRTGILLNV